VRRAAEHEREGGRDRRVEREERVRREAGEDRARPVAAERAAREDARGPERHEAEARQRDRMPGERQERTGHGRPQPRKVARDLADGARPGARVGAETGGGALDRAVHEDGGAVVEGMRQRRRRVDPADAVVRERELREERRRRRERMDRGADVVDEAGQRQLRGAASSADGVLGL